MPSKVWDEITYPFPNFNGATVEVWEWISYSTFYNGCNYLSMLSKGDPRNVSVWRWVSWHVRYPFVTEWLRNQAIFHKVGIPNYLQLHKRQWNLSRFIQSHMLNDWMVSYRNSWKCHFRLKTNRMFCHNRTTTNVTALIITQSDTIVSKTIVLEKSIPVISF